MFEHSRRNYKFVSLFEIFLLKSSFYFFTELSKKILNTKMLTLITLIVINSSCSHFVFVVWKLNFVISQHKYNKQVTSMVGSFARFLFTRCEEPLTHLLVPHSFVCGSSHHVTKNRTHSPTMISLYKQPLTRKSNVYLLSMISSKFLFIKNKNSKNHPKLHTHFWTSNGNDLRESDTLTEGNHPGLDLE